MFGTELNSAFAPFDSNNDVMSPFLQDTPISQRGSSSEIVHKSTPIGQLNTNGPVTQTQPQMQQPIVSNDSINLNQINNQMHQMSKMQLPQPSNNIIPNALNGGQQDPRIAILVNELKKQQMLTAKMQEQSGYLDKLFSKKKDMLRILQLALIIVLAMSIHFIIDFYMKFYIKNNDLSFERELLLRMLYPVGLIFILWNMKAFLK
jgi:hypothetical protein